MTPLLATLAARLVVSCQAEPGLPLDAPVHIAALAASAVLGGAAAVRVQGFDNIASTRAAVAVPVIGLVKVHRPGTEVYITPTAEDVAAVAAAGADVVAFDATDRTRPVPVRDLITAARDAGRATMADVSTVAEAEAALAAGADVVSTTMAGYTAAAASDGGPDLALVRELGRRGLPFAAEGRVRTPEEAALCLDLGALFVVVGGAITRPDAITRAFVARIAQGRAAR